MRKFVILATCVASLAVGGVASAGTAGHTLTGTVGPEDTITLSAGGHAVSKLQAGSYTIVVRDRAGDHDFHFYGPGVNRTTSVGGTGTVTWHVKLRKGTYRFICDPHATFMKGALKVA